MSDEFKIKTLTLFQFRGFREERTLALHPRLNVFFGVNGSGKSTVLRALNILLSSFISDLTHTQSMEWPGPDDIFNSGKLLRIQAELGKGILLDHDYDLEGQTYIKNTDKIQTLYLSPLNENKNMSLPLIAFYPVTVLLLNRLKKKVIKKSININGSNLLPMKGL